MLNGVKLVATDLDGTFLKDDKSISVENLRMLELLGERKVIRVAATGRNFRKVKEVLPDHLPFDYIAYSSGAGIYDWQNNQLLYRQNLSQETVNGIIQFFIRMKMNFHLFRPVPENFRCWNYRGEETCEEFERYNAFHEAYSEQLTEKQSIDGGACQFLAIFPNENGKFLQTKTELEKLFTDIKVVRTSSPLHTNYTWMEIFHRDVSKGNAIKFLCGQKSIAHEYTLGIGNDYNDLDLLNFTSYSYLVANGPDDLKHRFLRAPSNEDNAFSVCLRNHLPEKS